jgi:hypothetical protein
MAYKDMGVLMRKRERDRDRERDGEKCFLKIKVDFPGSEEEREVYAPAFDVSKEKGKYY